MSEPEQKTWAPDPVVVAVEEFATEAILAIERVEHAIRQARNINDAHRTGMRDGLNMAVAVLRKMLQEQE